MSNIFHKSFDDIKIDDISELKEIGYEENQRIEYKSKMYGHGDEDRREMLRDVTSFANAYGGFLIIGIEEDEKNKPKEFKNIENTEDEKDIFDKVCLSCIEPRISGLKSKVFKINSINIILIRIPKSLKKPHMITFKGLNQFWIRHQDDKNPMSVDEIREACLNIQNAWKNIREFLKEREREIREEIGEESHLVIGSAPVTFDENIIDITDTYIKEFLMDPPNQTNSNPRLTFKMWGSPEAVPLPTLSGIKISHPHFITLELFRNGYYEVRIPINNIALKENSSLVLINNNVVSFAVNYFRALTYLNEYMGIDKDVVSFLSFFHIKNITMKFGRRNEMTGMPEQIQQIWNKQDLEIHATSIYPFTMYDSKAKYFVERIWNAFGFETIPYFEGDKYNQT